MRARGWRVDKTARQSGTDAAAAQWTHAAASAPPGKPVRGTTRCRTQTPHRQLESETISARVTTLPE
eukprot:2646721-Pleurochrysis_carterae.AAC.1